MFQVITLNRRSFWMLQALGWSCFYVSNLLGSIHDILHGPDTVYIETVCVACMFLGSLALYPVCRWLLRRPQSWLLYELKVGAGAVLVGNLCTLAIGLTLGWFNWAPTAMWSSFVLFLWGSLYFSIKQWVQVSEEKERLLRADAEARQARLLALRAQLNPHFLFNALNAVSTLVLDRDVEAATRMLEQIADLLRRSLEPEPATEVLLFQEMAFTEKYLAIQQTRLGGRLEFTLVVPEEARNALVPSMLLQPLVENAVQYGTAPLLEGGRISIGCMLLADRLRINISNSGPMAGQENSHGNGIGLRNTEERLRTLYGANHRFSLEWPECGGCEVTMELPFRTSGVNTSGYGIETTVEIA